MVDTPTNIALFGGTFDPPHLGHLDIAREAATRCALDRVIFIPCRQSPHKMDRSPVSSDDRIEMLRRCTSGEPWAEISRVEIDRDGPSYSWKTAEHFASLNPDARLHWILGEDQWSKLETWSRPERLRNLLTFIVFPRNGRDPAPRKGYRHHTLDLVHPASATEIRARLQSGARNDCSLHPSVSEYIRNHHLYEPTTS